MHNAMGSAMGEQEEGNFGKYLSKFAHSHKRLRRLEAKPEDEQTKLPCHKCLQNKLIIRRNLLGPSSDPPPPTRDPTESRGEEKKRRGDCQSCLSHMPQLSSLPFVAKSLKSTTYERYKNLHGCGTHTKRRRGVQRGQTDGDILPNMRGPNKLPSNMSGKPSKKIQTKSGAKAKQSKANETKRNET